jgi:hypothetical protein
MPAAAADSASSARTEHEGLFPVGSGAWRDAAVAACSRPGAITQVLQAGQRIVLAPARSATLSFFAHWGQVTIMKIGLTARCAAA